MRNKSAVFLALSLVYAFGVFLFIANTQPLKALADTNHVVISQIQISGTSANDEFVELYNPTTTAIDVSKWRLTRKTATGTSSQNLVASLSGTIAPKSYFLITHPSATTASIADREYSSSSSGMTTNNTITLYSDAGITVVDKVGMGTAGDAEGSPFAENPEGSGSIVRKATANSTAETLMTGGIEALVGNGFDIDNNSTDFVLFESSSPKNSSVTAIVPSITVIPSLAVTNTPPPSPTTTPTLIPTATPTNLPTSTQIPPTATPTALPSPTPTKTPTVVPTTAPTQVPTNTPLPTAIPTSTPTSVPTPTPRIIVDEQLNTNRRLVCTQSFRVMKVWKIEITIPQITCSIVKK